jgi:predicted small secreted protein
MMPLPRHSRGGAALGRGEQEMSHTLELLVGLVALLSLPSLSACNTARGFGQDIQALGRAMSGTAQEVEDDISGNAAPEQGPTRPVGRPAPEQGTTPP